MIRLSGGAFQMGDVHVHVCILFMYDVSVLRLLSHAARGVCSTYVRLSGDRSCAAARTKL